MVWLGWVVRVKRLAVAVICIPSNPGQQLLGWADRAANCAWLDWAEVPRGCA